MSSQLSLPYDSNRKYKLSALLAEPAKTPKGTVVALHGAGMSSQYFDADGQERSFMRLASAAGLRVLALDRPGYGASAVDFPNGVDINEQAVLVANAIRNSNYNEGPIFLLGHSFGSKIALSIASWNLLPVTHIEISGLGYSYAVDPTTIEALGSRSATRLHWGPIRCYPPGTFSIAREEIVTSTPPAEISDAVGWPKMLRRVAPNVTCTVHACFAQYERWWRASPKDILAMSNLFPRGVFNSTLIPGAGHNSSLGYTAREYHEGVCARILSLANSCQDKSDL